MLAQKPRAHQRRESERDQARSENCHDDRDRELAENAPEQSRHEDERDEDGRERERHREDGEGNFARAVHGRLDKWIHRARAADDVFEKDDRVIDEEADGERQRHEGEVVDRVIQRPHHQKVSRSESGNATIGIRVSAARPRKTKMTRTTSTKAIKKRDLHVVN